MLKNIPSILSPELLKVLMEMGHGDEIVIADGNFPSASTADATVTKKLVRLDGHGVPEILDAILQLMPLDSYVEKPVALMDNGDSEHRPEVWKEYEKIVKKYEGDKSMELVERYAFYTRAKRAYAIVATGETATYANIILKKGVVQ
jgi:L-fucose mutarotase